MLSPEEMSSRWTSRIQSLGGSLKTSRAWEAHSRCRQKANSYGQRYPRFELLNPLLTMSSCISQERPWSKNLEQSSHSGRVQHQGSARRTDMVLPSMGTLRVTAGRLRIPDVTTGREQSPRLFLLLRCRLDDNHSIRLSSRRR